MIGKATVPKWRYGFDCRGCLQIREMHDGVHEGRYCVPMLQGRDPIHADDDRVIRCDCWRPEQRSMFEGGEESALC
jgi:hypothetical protein